MLWEEDIKFEKCKIKMGCFGFLVVFMHVHALVLAYYDVAYRPYGTKNEATYSMWLA
jgi:hypothetical protein